MTSSDNVNRNSANISNPLPSEKYEGFNFIIGTGVIVRDIKDKTCKVIVGKRKNSHGSGLWSLPGGRHEIGQTIVETARRELEEETGISIDLKHSNVPYTFPPTKDSLLPSFSKDCKTIEVLYTPAKLHQLVHIVVTDRPEGVEPQLMEPDKCEGWFWVDWIDIIKMSEYLEKKMRGEEYELPILSDGCPIDPTIDAIFPPLHMLCQTTFDPFTELANL